MFYRVVEQSTIDTVGAGDKILLKCVSFKT